MRKLIQKYWRKLFYSYMPSYDDVLWDGDLSGMMDDSMALAILLRDGICFVSPEYYSDYKDDRQIHISVLCNDVFAWGCADAEPLTPGGLNSLIREHMIDSKWGHVKWICKHRNEQPQDPIKDAMKKDGAWNDSMENLPPNEYWFRIKERKNNLEDELEDFWWTPKKRDLNGT